MSMREPKTGPLKRLFTMSLPEVVHAAELPIDMILFCPRCGHQHVDAPEGEWANPPHKSHLCSTCKCIWRPADVPTNGVLAIESRGKEDNWPTKIEVQFKIHELKSQSVEWECILCNSFINVFNEEVAGTVLGRHICR